MSVRRCHLDFASGSEVAVVQRRHQASAFAGFERTDHGAFAPRFACDNAREMAGILSYGAYIPYYRLERSSLASGGRGERAVASFDEDSTSLAVEAGRETLRGCVSTPGSLLVASTSHSYAEKLNASAVHAALGLPPAVRSVDLASSSRSGLAALALASEVSGCAPVLACAADVVVGAPAGPRESAGGDAACAFLVGDAPGAGAVILGTASHTEELLDAWRGPEQQFTRQWEERFVEKRLVPALGSVFERCLDRAGLAVSDLTVIAVDTAHPRIAGSFASKAGLQPGQLVDDLAASVGRAGAANAGLLLARMLDSALPGDRIAVLSAADGAEAVIVEVTKQIAKARPRRSVAQWIESNRGGLPYQTYLKWREILPFEPPRRPDPPRPAAPPMQRAERWKYAFVGSRCLDCGAINLPPQRVCVQCGAVDRMDSVACADAKARVATYTVDHLAYSLQQPVIAAVVDFDQGGRIACELADVEPDKVTIGQELEMTFRRLYTAEGVRNYFWKARPLRGPETR